MGVPTKVQDKTDTGQQTSLSDQISRSSQTRPHSAGSSNSPEEGCYRGSSGRSRSRLLLQAIPGAKEKRQAKTCDRLEETQQVSPDPTFPYGDNSISVGKSSSGELYILIRPHGRLFPCPNPSGLSEIPPLPIRRQSLSVYSSPIRTLNQPMAVHKNSVGSQTDGTSHDYPSHGLSGRLAGTGSLLPTGSSANSNHAGSLLSTRSFGESREIGSDPIPELQVHRGQIRSHPVSGFSCGTQQGEGHSTSSDIHTQRQTDGQEMAVTSGHSGLSRQICQVCSVSYQTPSVVSGTVLESEIRSSRQTDICPSSHQDQTPMVVRPLQTQGRGTIDSSPVRSQALYRRISQRLGRSSRTGGVSGSLVSTGVSTPYQCPGNARSQENSPGSLSPSRLQPVSSDRQYNSSRLHKQGGRDQVLASHERDNPPISVVNQQGLDSESQIHSRQTQCHRGPTVQTGPNSANRVVSVPSSSERSISDLGSSSNRSFRHKVQQQVSSVCISSSRPKGLGSRHTIPRPGGNGRVCLPSSSTSDKVSSEISGNSQVQNHPDSTILAQTTMVPQTSTTSSQGPNSVTSQTISHQTTLDRYLSQSSGSSQPPRMASREVDLQSRGFESSVIQRVVKPHAQTTESIYDGKWKAWVAWCTRNGVDVYSPSIAKVADFLSFLFNEQKIEYSTLAGYRSMLSGALFHTGLDLGHNKDLADLMMSFKHSRPPRSKVFPDWDLSLILWTLSEPPFEPMFDESKVSMQFVTWKTVFLVLLAAGVRRGELHAIPYKNVSYDKDFTHVTLRPSESFITKTQIKTGNKLKPFRIPSLTSVLGNDLQLDRKLCPCRALKHFIKRSEPVRKSDPTKTLLFVSYDPRKKGDICKNTISGWISQLIRFCYSQPGSKALQLTGTRAHEVRAYASSLVSKGTSAIDDILMAGNWRSHNTFTNHYLRDISHQEGDLLRIGPIVAGQKVVIHTSVQ